MATRHGQEAVSPWLGGEGMGGKDGDGVGWIAEWGRDFIGLREWCGGRFDDDGDGGDAMARGNVRLETAQAVRGNATARQWRHGARGHAGDGDSGAASCSWLVRRWDGRRRTHCDGTGTAAWGARRGSSTRRQATRRRQDGRRDGRRGGA